MEWNSILLIVKPWDDLFISNTILVRIGDLFPLFAILILSASPYPPPFWLTLILCSHIIGTSFSLVSIVWINFCLEILCDVFIFKIFGG